MPLIPWEYIKKHLSLPKITPKEIGEKLTYHGLETKVVEHRNKLYLEFDILPNRPDLLSWRGIIQEIGIILNCQVKPLDFSTIKNESKNNFEVMIDTNDCSKIYLNLVKNIEVKESPLWIKEWLAINNIRSINNLVDSANLAMLESGQPLHIFDYDSLLVKKMVVRKVHYREKINTLQGQELTLDSEDIIISSGEKIISLAGIIGGQITAITPQTKNILIECAEFNSKIIKKTAQRLNISTKTSHLFSRKANLVLSPEQVLSRTFSLIAQTCPRSLNYGIIFSFQRTKKTLPVIIAISQEFITKKVGQILPEQAVENIWQRLKFSYYKKENIYHITVPLSRPDIIIAEDLLEELLRIYDYNKVIGLIP